MYKLIIKGENKPFTYTIGSYSFEDFFIVFMDRENRKRRIPKDRIIEIIEDED